MAGATTLGDLASAIGVRAQEAAVIAELKAGSEDAYAWLIGEFHQPVYGLIYRIVNDPSDAADTTQDVFLKVFRGMKHFHGESCLKTWIYRIAIKRCGVGRPMATSAAGRHNVGRRPFYGICAHDGRYPNPVCHRTGRSPGGGAASAAGLRRTAPAGGREDA